MDRVMRGREKTVDTISETVDIGDMILKLDEIVQWINEHDNKYPVSPEIRREALKIKKEIREKIRGTREGGDPAPK